MARRRSQGPSSEAGREVPRLHVGLETETPGALREASADSCRLDQAWSLREVSRRSRRKRKAACNRPRLWIYVLLRKRYWPARLTLQTLLDPSSHGPAATLRIFESWTIHDAGSILPGRGSDQVDSLSYRGLVGALGCSCMPYPHGSLRSERLRVIEFLRVDREHDICHLPKMTSSTASVSFSAQ